jgi:DNA repair protein RadD
MSLPNGSIRLPSFEQLLSRADEALLQELLGRSTMRLLQATQGRDLSLAGMRRVLIAMRPPELLLEDRNAVRIMLEMFRPEEMQALRDLTGLKDLSAESGGAGLSPRSAAFAVFLSGLGVNRSAAADLSEPQHSVVCCQPTRALFPHQREALRKAEIALSVHPRRVMLHMPTGSGKTRTAMQLVANHLRQTPDGTVVWLATSEELCDQAAREFGDAWQCGGDREIKMIRLWGSHQLQRDVICSREPKVIIAGLSKLHSARMQDQTLLPFLGDVVTLVVFDEAHQAIAPTYRGVTDGLLSRNLETKLLGLTATPGRTWNDIGADSELSNYFGSMKVTLEVPGFKSPIDYLIKEGYLAKPNFRRIVGSLASRWSATDRDRLAESLDVPEDLRERLADDDLRNVAIVRETESLLRNHSRILVFAATVRHAELLAAALGGMGLAAAAVTGKTSPERRSRFVNWFRDESDEARTLVNYGVFTTGFDAPRTSAAVIARPTKSLVLFSQMVGRALRGPRAGGNPAAEIVTVVDTSLPGFGDLVAAFTNWEDVW